MNFKEEQQVFERIEHLETRLRDLESLLEDILNINTCDQCGKLTQKSMLQPSNDECCADICSECWSKNDITARELEEQERRSKLPPEGPLPEFGNKK